MKRHTVIFLAGTITAIAAGAATWYLYGIDWVAAGTTIGVFLCTVIAFIVVRSYSPAEERGNGVDSSDSLEEPQPLVNVLPSDLEEPAAPLEGIVSSWLYPEFEKFQDELSLGKDSLNGLPHLNDEPVDEYTKSVLRGAMVLMQTYKMPFDVAKHYAELDINVTTNDEILWEQDKKTRVPKKTRVEKALENMPQELRDSFNALPADMQAELVKTFVNVAEVADQEEPESPTPPERIRHKRMFNRNKVELEEEFEEPEDTIKARFWRLRNARLAREEGRCPYCGSEHVVASSILEGDVEVPVRLCQTCTRWEVIGEEE